MDNSTHGMSEQLIRYLDGELQGADRKAVEDLLASDPEVKAELESLQQTRAAVRYYGLRQKVEILHSAMMEEMSPPVVKMSSGKKFLRYSLATAASLVLLLGAYLAYNFFTLSPNKLFSANYKTYELSTLRDAGETEPAQAEKAYREKNYKEVVRLHDAGIELSPRAEFLCGIAALELNEDAKAIKCFREVLDAAAQTGQPVLKDESEYYLSLSYIRNRDYDFALPILLKIKNDPDHKYNRSVSSRMIWRVKMLKWR